jgi:hypothetical protein
MDHAINAALPRELRATVCFRGQSVFMSELRIDSVLATNTASSLDVIINVCIVIWGYLDT